MIDFTYPSRCDNCHCEMDPIRDYCHKCPGMREKTIRMTVHTLTMEVEEETIQLPGPESYVWNLRFIIRRWPWK